MFGYKRTALLENNHLKEIVVEENNAFNIGDILVAKVKKILPSKFAFLDIGEEKNAFLALNDKKEKGLYSYDENKKKYVLQIKEGQDLIVQVEKEGTDLKGMTVTTNLKLTGKYLVLLLKEENIGISKKIDIDEQRETFNKIAKEILPKGYGIIFRTNCKNISKNIIENELIELIKNGEEILEKGKYLMPPNLLYKAKSETEKMIIDVLEEEDEVIVNNRDEYLKLLDNMIFKNIRLYEDSLPIFEVFSVEQQLEKLMHNKIWLKSGAFLIIEKFEAMTVIDVNTGKNVQKKYDEMVLKTNLEALKEALNQIRLRNLSGIIILDLIDMKSQEDKIKIYETAKRFAKEDRNSIIMYPITELGLLQMTRKKRLKPIYEVIMKNCNACNGFGKVKNENYIANTIKNKLISICSNTIFNKIIISSNSKIIKALRDNFNIKEIEDKFSVEITTNVINTNKIDYFEIEKFKI